MTTETERPSSLSSFEKIGADILKKIESLASYVPTVALLGKTGMGKSSLGNSLFGDNVFEVSNVRAGTRKIQPATASILGATVSLIDFPGIGESPERDEEYRKLYSEQIAKTDVALWVLKMDDRALSPDLEYFENILKPAGFPIDRIVFVISQAEKADPIRQWNDETSCPGREQLMNINEKIWHIAETFSVPLSRVVAVSAAEKYNLHLLAERIIDACPAKAALNLGRSLEPELNTKTVKKGIAAKIWDTLKGAYAANQSVIHSVAVDFIVSLMSKRFAGGKSSVPDNIASEK